MVTYHLSKNLSPRTFLVFMENHAWVSLVGGNKGYFLLWRSVLVGIVLGNLCNLVHTGIKRWVANRSIGKCGTHKTNDTAFFSKQCLRLGSPPCRLIELVLHCRYLGGGYKDCWASAQAPEPGCLGLMPKYIGSCEIQDFCVPAYPSPST